MQDNRENTDIIEKLLKDKLGQLYGWKMPVISKTVGPYSPEVFLSFEVRHTELIDECKGVLEKFTTPDLATLLHLEFDDQDETRLAWKNLLKSEITELSRHIPNWMLGGFGHSDFEADFEYWGKMAKFELDEALLLSVGIEPRHVGTRVLDAVSQKIDQDRLFPAMEYLAKRRVQFQRHFPDNYGDWYSIRPRNLKSWFDEVSLDVHVDFYAELERRFPKEKVKEENEIEKDISPQERETLLKLIAAMACEQYNFNPELARSSATSSIRDDIETVGLTMDSNTIRKWLKEAMALVPKAYWDK
ncbi:MAG: hypothetical protein QM488_17070 [Rhizobiaceae bacterium]